MMTQSESAVYVSNLPEASYILRLARRRPTHVVTHFTAKQTRRWFVIRLADKVCCVGVENQLSNQHMRDWDFDPASAPVCYVIGYI
jgi:hypothetical protein